MPELRREHHQWFEEEVRPHEPLLRAWLRRQFPSGLDVDDIVQESYVRILRARERRPIDSAKAYLFAIARTTGLLILRKNKPGRQISLDEIEGESIMDDAVSVAEAVNNRLELSLALAAIETLPPRCREIIVLRALDGLSHREIALRLHISEQTVRVQVANALRLCARYMRQRGVTTEHQHGNL